jgi:hypothetical protein
MVSQDWLTTRLARDSLSRGSEIEPDGLQINRTALNGRQLSSI